jgi:hypothetical protein
MNAGATQMSRSLLTLRFGDCSGTSWARTNLKVDETLRQKLYPFEKREILVCATYAYHTSVFRLARNLSTVRIYDSLNGTQRWDEKLLQGINLLLEATGLKPAKENFKYESADLFHQEDDTSCGLMVFMNVTHLLTGESFDSKHC